MNKLFKKSLLSILVAMFTVFSFTTLTNKVHAKSDTILDISDDEINPAYVTDIFWWTKTSTYSTFSYNIEGNNIKFKTTKYGNSDYVFSVNRKTYIASELRSKIDRIISLENSLFSTFGAASAKIALVLLTTGVFSPAVAFSLGVDSGVGYTLLKNLFDAYEDTKAFVRANC